MRDQDTGDIHWRFWEYRDDRLKWNLTGLINVFIQLKADTAAAFQPWYSNLAERKNWIS